MLLWLSNLILIAYVCLVAGEDHLNNKLFATKTPYERSRLLFSSFLNHSGTLKTPVSLSHYHGNSQGERDNQKLFYPDVCVPKQLTIVLRHGTRYPSKGDVKRVAEFIEKFKTLDIIESFIELKDWHNDFTQENEKLLADAGMRENYDIAQRFVQSFPELFQQALKQSKQFEFMASNTQRTIASAKGFAKGIADMMEIKEDDITAMLELRNDLLRFFESCSSYKYKIEDNDDAVAEFNVFKHGDEMKAAARSVSKRISKTGDETLFDTDDLRSMWVICGFETALRGNGRNSKWCDMLTSEETRVLEYAWDLKSFWRKAYGYTLNFEQACPLLTDIMVNFHHTSINESAPAVSLYFGHAETLLPLQALLGLFQDDDVLTSSNYQKHKTRKFRTSLTASFAANLALVMYECSEGKQTTHSDWPENLSNLMVQAIANEHIVYLPFTDQAAVSVEDFESHYYQYVHHCEFDKLCENEPKIVKLGRDEL